MRWTPGVANALVTVAAGLAILMSASAVGAASRTESAQTVQVSVRKLVSTHPRYTANIQVPRLEWKLRPAVARRVNGAIEAWEQTQVRAFAAEVTLGVGPVRGRYRAEIRLSDLEAPRGATLSGTIAGGLGDGTGVGHVRLIADGAGATTIEYDYEVRVGGKVAAVGDRLLAGASRIVIGAFFDALAKRAGGGAAGRRLGLFAWLRRWFGFGR